MVNTRLLMPRDYDSTRQRAHAMTENELQVCKEEVEYAEGQRDHYRWHN